MLPLEQEPRWLKFCERYMANLPLFAIEVLGVDVISSQQLTLLEAVQVPRSRVSVSSGHSTGKTFSISAIVLWHLTCYLNSVTLLTANDADQLKSTVWKEISTRVESLKGGYFDWLYHYIDVLADGTMRIKGHEKNWFVESKTANAKTANKMAGRHAKWLLIIGDEASTIPDEVLKTLYGALSEEYNRMLLTSQGTRNAGEFWRTHNELSVNQGGDWLAFVFSSFDSPWASDEFLRQMWEEYDDDERAIRLLGEFPQDSSKTMMSLKDANSMYSRSRIIKDDEHFGWVLLADIASGEGLRDKSSCVIARVIGSGDLGDNARRVEIFSIPLLTNNIRSNVFSNYLVEQGDSYNNITYVVDAGGLGVNVCQDLEDKNKTLHRVWWGAPCFKKKNKDRYLNLRAQAMHQAARAVKEGRLSILCNDHKRVMLSQSSRIPKEFTDGAKIKVPSKGTSAWDGLGSPDLWDAVCFAFLENVEYMASEQDFKKSDKITSKDKAVEAMEDFFN